MERIERLRARALDNKIDRREFHYLFYKQYMQSREEDEFLRYADAFYYAFSNLSPFISEDELIVGAFVVPLSEEKSAEWEEKYLPFAAEEVAKRTHSGQDSHMEIDYALILREGLMGICNKIDRLMEDCSPEKIPFYKSCKICLLAAMRHAERYAEKAEELAEAEKNKKRRNELLKIASICRKVPAYPAETFYEAVQAVHFVTHCVTVDPLRFNDQQYQLGHPDRYLWSFYKRDIERGTLTKEYAQLLLNCLGIQINMRVPRGLSSGYMVGGRDEKGNIVANELTEMCMKVIDDIRLVYPAVGLCYTEGMDDFYLETACRILSRGRSHPAIFNDDVITKGLMYYGVPENEAHTYIHSTCVEITPSASSNVWVASPYTNVPQLLLDVMDREYTGFDALLSAFFAVLDNKIKENYEEQMKKRKIRAENGMKPFLSCFVRDCLEKGVDIERGGARYNWIMPSFVGVANLVDALCVIKELIFDKKEYTMKGFREILRQNFEGHELLLHRIEKEIPKYGNDNDDVDQYFGLITEHIIATCAKYKGMHQNGNIIPSVFCWEKHEKFGRETGATPDGRKAEFPLGDGSGPCQGRELYGPTSSILSSTKWKHHKLIGGVAVNMKFSKNRMDENAIQAMKNLIKTYLKRGGFEIQINVTNHETLEKAIKNPKQYRDLVVRIGGYSDYFVKLSPGMQQEVLRRTEHRI